MWVGVAMVVALSGCASILGFEEPVDPDSPVPSVRFELAASLYEETSSTVTIPLALSEASDRPVTVEWIVEGGSANKLDYQVASTTVTFAPGEVRRSIEIAITADDDPGEPDETVLLAIASVVNAAVDPSASHHQMTILRGLLPRVRFDAPVSATTSEGMEVVAAVALDVASAVPVTVGYVVGGTATTQDHAALVPVTVTFDPGVIARTVRVDTLDDTLDEDIETISLVLANPTNAVIGSANVYTLSITDNDPSPLVRFMNPSDSVVEAATDVVATLKLEKPSGRAVTVPFTVGGTATDGMDFTITPSPVVIPAGATTAQITITLINDTITEGSETVEVSLGTPSNANLGDPDTYTLTIPANLN